ncbi:MAG: asparagine synthase (glutamine-hydrolyzing) [Acidobacteriota bacterium]
MCGIAGLFRASGITDTDVEVIRRMNRVMKHRGPDDEGIYNDTHCVLGHRRLAIIDLSKDGHQPFESEDGRFQLVFNGEIYNYIELRQELERFGVRFRTKTDTEVLLAAYLRFGVECLDRLNGMFAFAVYDSLAHSLFLARDRVGVKPLYYVDTGTAFYFASEIKAFRETPSLTFSVNPRSLFDYLAFNRTDVYDETFFSEVKRLPKGHYMHLDSRGARIRQWWNPEDHLRSASNDSLETICERIEELLVSSTRLRMRSDVPVGSCLSGGLDSSILVGILFSHCGSIEGYPTFTASFPGHRLDETGYIDRLNDRFAFSNHRTFPTAETALENLPEFVFYNDEPTTSASFYSQYEVMRLARNKGVTVLLDGQGGDESFAGYQYFHGFYLYGLLRRGNLSEFGAELCRCLLRKQHVSAYQTLLFQVLPDRIRENFLLRTVPYMQPRFFSDHIRESRIYNGFFNVDGLNGSLVRHFQYKLEHLLRMEDRNSMAFSLEARVPYLDYRLIEYVLGLPEELKIRRGETKYLQKRSLGRYTVEEILKRKDKIGFGTPTDAWMQDPTWRRLTADRLDSLTRALPEVFKRDAQVPRSGTECWKINQLAVWLDLFIK